MFSLRIMPRGLFGLIVASSFQGTPLLADDHRLVIAVRADDEKKEKPAAKEFTPKFDQSTLEFDGQKQKPSKAIEMAFREYWTGDYRIAIDSDHVRAFRTADDKLQWEIKAPAEIRLIWLGADKQVIYLMEYATESKTKKAFLETLTKIRRLELTSGKWLNDIQLVEPIGKNQSESVSDLLVGDDCVIVLSEIGPVEPGTADYSKLRSYRVSSFKSVFKGDHEKPVWSKTFDRAPAAPNAGAFLLSAARYPDSAGSASPSLVWFGDELLVQAGPTEDLLCLKSANGEVRWKLERVWEYERGFIGPSVWQHYLSRAGKGPWDEQKGQNEQKEQKGEKKPAVTLGHNSVVAGPIVVSHGLKKSIFLAVAKGPAQWGAYLSECIVYEISSSGKPIGITTLPRMVLDSASTVHDSGVVWACQGGGFVRLLPSEDSDAGFGMGPGGPNMLANVEWFRQVPKPKVKAWLSSDPAGDPIAFGESYAVRVNDGGSATDRVDSHFRFPLTLIDLKTGMPESAVLNVPFEGTIPEPKTNYRSTESGKKTFGPYLLAVTRLQVTGENLNITVGMQHGATRLVFDLKSRTKPMRKSP